MNEIKPNFFIVGAAKSATTSIYYYLQQHPDVFFTEYKEPWYFCYDNCKSPAGIDTMEKYMDLFKGAGNALVVGEASVSYLCFDDVADKLKKFAPDAKILISLRNPVDRAFSYYSMYRMKQIVDKEFEYYIDNGLNHSGVDVINSGFYYEQVKKYLDVYGDNVKIILYEDVKDDINGVLKGICEFLDIDADFEFNTKKQFNQTFQPKYKFITKLLYTDNLPKRIASKFLPKRVRLRMLLNIQNINKVKKPVISDTQRETLKKLYKDDIVLLRKH